ncbi:hypothetical protein PRZ48_005607 [Zasmidium cellare]|uniref:Uncharacterized protein n=1 Tax=Zasmidium cellare TaxID=395010 RepID=A0ABR0EL25_ZASCE|nr:hypothetical protein PRZ48_005607 [Zasmidium cellare]
MSSLQISGPTTAGQPNFNNDWFTSWASYVKKNNSIPDQYAWHEESENGSSMSSSYDGLIAILKQNQLPLKTININEYAIFDEEVPAGSAFWISQLERYNAIGLRGNWLGGTQLHDLAASLLSKPDPNNYASTDYFPNGDYQVYKYYSQNMTGNRVGTSVSQDGKFDAYATVGGGLAKVLMGVRPPTQGTYTVSLSNLTALGLPASGNLNVRTWKFPVGSDVHYSGVDGPTDLGYISHSYSGNTLALPYYQTDKLTAYAWEFAVGK